MVLVLCQDHTFEKKPHMDTATTVSLKLPAYVPLTFPWIDIDTIFVCLPPLHLSISSIKGQNFPNCPISLLYH